MRKAGERRIERADLPFHFGSLGIIGNCFFRATLQGMPFRTVMGWFDKPLHMLIARPNIRNV
jgi:hypothetical protein